MPFREAFRLAFHVIWSQKMKSGFSVIGVFIGVTFLIAVVTIINGMNTYMEDDFAGALLGVNTFELRRRPIVVSDVDAETWRAWMRRPRIRVEDAQAIEKGLNVPVMVGYESSARASVHYGSREIEAVRITGAAANYFQIKSIDIERGRAFSSHEVKTSQPVAVLGFELAEKLFQGIDPIGRQVKIRGIPYRVIGIAEKQGNVFGISLDNFVVAPATAPVKRFLNPPGIVDVISVKAVSLPTLREAMNETEAIMRSRRNLRPGQENNFAIDTADSVLSFWNKIHTVMMAALPMLVGISLVVGGIVIMNIMLMAVAERTREIGIRKSLGARRRDIMRQFVVESAALATVGAALGVGTGLVMAWTVNTATWLPASVAPWSIWLGVALGAGVGLVAGVYPASRAARLDPIVAMRQE